MPQVLAIKVHIRRHSKATCNSKGNKICVNNKIKFKSAQLTTMIRLWQAMLIKKQQTDVLNVQRKIKATN